MPNIYLRPNILIVVFLYKIQANCPDPWVVPESGTGCFLHSDEPMNFFEAEEVKKFHNEYFIIIEFSLYISKIAIR